MTKKSAYSASSASYSPFTFGQKSISVKTLPAQTLSNLHLLVIVLAQFAGTSLWFAGNAILADLQPLLGTTTLNGWITSAVQLGFIVGTLVYSLYGIADRFPSARVFLVSVVLAAGFNLLFLALPLRAEWVLMSRFGTGFFLAGVYPVGMKIAADWFRPVLGRAMGFLVGALVLGTAFPHLIRGLGGALPYAEVLLSVSGLAVVGGLLLFVVVPSKLVINRRNRLSTDAFRYLFKPGDLRAGTLGYFGHMWELYTVWAFLPVLFALYAQQHPDFSFNRSVWTFVAMAVGFLGCAGGGFLALRVGSRRVAVVQLAISGMCTALVPFILSAPPVLFGLYLLIYGITISGDSPQLTTLVSANAPLDNRGSVLTLLTCIGFSITIVSIQLMAWVLNQTDQAPWAFCLLVPGPVLGVWGLVSKTKL
ncbi:MAG: MFS transporter [Cytophagales bacterium]|nr:MAG: MFS transporter [Cytophagales bacterium]